MCVKYASIDSIGLDPAHWKLLVDAAGRHHALALFRRQGLDSLLRRLGHGHADTTLACERGRYDAHVVQAKSGRIDHSGNSCLLGCARTRAESIRMVTAAHPMTQYGAW
jgi:hypothetical protein